MIVQNFKYIHFDINFVAISYVYNEMYSSESETYKYENLDAVKCDRI